MAETQIQCLVDDWVVRQLAALEADTHRLVWGIDLARDGDRTVLSRKAADVGKSTDLMQEVKMDEDKVQAAFDGKDTDVDLPAFEFTDSGMRYLVFRSGSVTSFKTAQPDGMVLNRIPHLIAKETIKDRTRRTDVRYTEEMGREEVRIDSQTGDECRNLTIQRQHVAGQIAAFVHKAVNEAPRTPYVHELQKLIDEVLQDYWSTRSEPTVAAPRGLPPGVNPSRTVDTWPKEMTTKPEDDGYRKLEAPREMPSGRKIVNDAQREINERKSAVEAKQWSTAELNRMKEIELIERDRLAKADWLLKYGSTMPQANDKV